MPGLVIPYRDVIAADGQLTRIEYYHEEDVDRPTAYSRFLTRMGWIHQEYSYWKTVIPDSVTFMELCSRKVHEKVWNPVPNGKTKQTLTKGDGVDPRQWFGGSTDDLEEMVIMRFGALPMNVVAIMHIDERKNEVSGEILRGPNLPGRLSKRGIGGAAYQEFYHAYRVPDQAQPGKYIHQLQTAPRNGFAATTQLSVPDPCWPTYEAMWQNWNGARPNVHCAVYGDYGMGKSTFAATWPGPRLVFSFDYYGKDLPYQKGAQSISEMQYYQLG